MNKDFQSLHDYLEELNDEYGGDITFVPVVDEEHIQSLEKKISWKIPMVLRSMLLKECNGLIIGSRRLYSVTDPNQKKTLVDSFERNNDPGTSRWFKNHPQIFKDYMVVGEDGDICFCYSKKYDLENPSVYICENPNGKDGVDFERLDLDLEGLIKVMIDNEFND